jgi:hypothetical protein
MPRVLDRLLPLGFQLGYPGVQALHRCPQRHNEGILILVPIPVPGQAAYPWPHSQVLTGKKSRDFMRGVEQLLVFSPCDADELEIEGGISWKTWIVELCLLSG